MIVLTIIYNYYSYHFILAGLILLIAMVGAIVLTLNVLIKVKKQEYYKQNMKNNYNSLVLKGTLNKPTNLFRLRKKSFIIPKKKP